MKRRVLLFAATVAITLGLLPAPQVVAQTPEKLWVATTGSDTTGTGTETNPYATLQMAVDEIDSGGEVWVKDGTYTGHTEIDRRWTGTVTIRPENPLAVRLQNESATNDGEGGMVVHFNGAENVRFEGFDITQNGPSTSDGIIFIDWASLGGVNTQTDDIQINKNVIHDSQPSSSGSGDLIKASNGCHDVLIDENVFVNPGANEQGLDLNSCVDSEVEDNLFWSDYPGTFADHKGYIVIKDSGGTADGQVGAENIWVQRNVFGNVQQADTSEMFAVQIGADGRSYYEAHEIFVQNNLVLGNSSNNTGRPFGVEGAQNVEITHNTISGDLPVTGQHFVTIRQDEDNQPVDGLVLANNLISDPTGTMGTANPSDGSRSVIGGHSTGYTNLTFDNNGWFNDGLSFPTGGILQHDDDANRVVADPLLNENHASVVGPSFDFATGEFESGELASWSAIEHEHDRLVAAYAAIPSNSPMVDVANDTYCPVQDITGEASRPATDCDIGAWEDEIQP